MNQKSERERLQKRAWLLAAFYSISLTAFVSSLKIEKTTTKETYSYTKVTPNLIYLHDFTELHHILGYKTVTDEDLKIAIENANIPESFKNAAYQIIKDHSSDEDYDFRLFYNNLISLNVCEYESKEEFKAKAKEKYGCDNSAIAFYSPKDNTIYCLKNASNATRAHEMEHVANNWQRKIGDITFLYSPCNYNKNTSFGSSIEEAMTNRAIANITKEKSYSNEKIVLDFLLKYTTFDYFDYHEEGVRGLINSYPIDNQETIISIIKELDKINEKLLKKIDVKVDEFNELLLNCFTLCTKNINIKHPYTGFSRFYLILQQRELKNSPEYHELLSYYLKLYNDILTNLGIKDLITIEEIEDLETKYQEVDCLYIINNKIYPGIRNKNCALNYNGEEVQGTYYNENSVDNLPDLLISSYFDNKNLFYISRFWSKLVKENRLISPHLYQDIPIYVQDKKLKEANIKDFYVTIGKDKKGNLTFALYSYDNPNDPIWQSSNKPVENAGSISLFTYLKLYNYIEEIHLEEIFSHDYLRSYCKEKGYYINFLKYDEETDTFIILPKYIVKIKDNITASEFLNNIFIHDINGLTCNIKGIIIHVEVPYHLNQTISLEDILKFFKILNDDRLEYVFTKEELTELITLYVEMHPELIIEYTPEEIEPMKLELTS